jgi:hypothetical protein
MRLVIIGARNRDEGCKLPLLVNAPTGVPEEDGGGRTELSKVFPLAFDVLGGSWSFAEGLGEVEPCQAI